MDIGQDNKEINKALEEFEVKLADNEQKKAELISKASETPKMIGWVIKYSRGIIKDERQAVYVLFGVMIINIIIIFFLSFNNDRDSSSYTPPLTAPPNQSQNENN